jgi:serine/threonine-protein kinase
VVANKYRIERVLGVGGVGFVVAATHVELGGLFALKFLKRRFLHDKTIGERFTREARAACQIVSDYVARVYDVGSHDGAPFIVMEHLVGRDLSVVLADRDALGYRESAEYAVQACVALAAAHAKGIVHRDIKPENLFVVDELGSPTIKLLDFGISKFALAPAPRPSGDEWHGEEPLTGAHTCGTPDYMSPEQIRSTANVDGRSDIWSLGMVLYELVASEPAFQGRSVADLCAAILEREPRRLDEVCPDVPAGFADVVARCLQKDPARRFATAADLAVALLPFAPPRARSIAESSPSIRRLAIAAGTAGGASPSPSSSAAATAPRRADQGPPPRNEKGPSLSSGPAPRARAGPEQRRGPRRWLGPATAIATCATALVVSAWMGAGGPAADAQVSPARIDPPGAAAPPAATASSAGTSTPSAISPPPSTPYESAAAPVPTPFSSSTHPKPKSVVTPASSKAEPSPSSLPSAQEPPALPPSQGSAWPSLTTPPARSVRRIDSSNPWSEAK